MFTRVQSHTYARAPQVVYRDVPVEKIVEKVVEKVRRTVVGGGNHHHHHASLLKGSIKQVVCFGAWAGSPKKYR